MDLDNRLKSLNIDKNNFDNIFMSSRILNLFVERINIIEEALHYSVGEYEMRRNKHSYYDRLEIFYDFIQCSGSPIDFITIGFVLHDTKQISAKCSYSINETYYTLSFKKSKIHKITLQHIVDCVLVETINDIKSTISLKEGMR